VPVRVGSLVNGHPYIEILVSPDGKKSAKQTALVDTGFSGFISIPIESAKLMGLKAHATALYTLANGKTSNPAPLAHGYGPSVRQLSVHLRATENVCYIRYVRKSLAGNLLTKCHDNYA